MLQDVIFLSSSVLMQNLSYKENTEIWSNLMQNNLFSFITTEGK